VNFRYLSPGISKRGWHYPVGQIENAAYLYKFFILFVFIGARSLPATFTRSGEVSEGHDKPKRYQNSKHRKDKTQWAKSLKKQSVGVYFCTLLQTVFLAILPTGDATCDLEAVYWKFHFRVK